ncbi:uncharacterized protein LOC135808840 [Sycon ciliatum]|uniref:uncharacterized protein LOC135808840 n=1 Tax=Sycon ciliatum TaxID=27933 RepID=UPI0020A8C6D7
MRLTLALLARRKARGPTSIGVKGRNWIGPDKRQRSISIQQWRNWEGRKQIEANSLALLERPTFLTALEDRILDGSTLYDRDTKHEHALREVQRKHVTLRVKLGHLSPMC